MLEKALLALKIAKNNNRIPFSESWKNHPIGYPRLAERIGVKPETGIYRRFDALNARHLLYLQAELCDIESALRARENADHGDKRGKRSQYATDYRCFLEEPSDMDMPQLRLINRMHAKLHQYNEALLEVSLLHQLEAPDQFDLNDVQFFLSSDDMGPNEMKGRDSTSWGDCDTPTDHPPDLIAVHPRKKEDLFSHIVAEKGVHLFKCGLGRITKGNKHVGHRIYYDSTVLKMTFLLTSAMAALIPIASILVLVRVKTLNTQLWIIAALNILISVCLTFFTEAKRTDVFAVNAAFAAVQVVFIQGQGQGQN
ncbi:hypothetical protein HBI56_128050 [Parastagonospora nodorum]|nr:hypothetical protein HBH53_177270 [Parastagonospora nodorum]KAH3996744.1 hypothetical protein HBI10_149890 [Parastagonospora nodorum]KAH4009094.1 hypothetical protein HBI13_223960 [Parastagonospora nodorum]KAH4353047.1 hypothetical protein HBH98_000330 [Parastagonospora nodorum]KAH4359544.1 hypothetical protein HBH97_210610 [Parastagonospora nodorum]